MTPTQKSLEQYFAEYGVTDADKKAKLLPLITDLIYDRNMHVVNLETEADEYRKHQIEEGIAELEDEIKRQFESCL
ncbi:MAG: hypothetical protein ACD_66C00177G0004 [uncultured bacterium]|uniref:Uncharacterized protein n=1 Tax=Candidatus Uhrbacteria bacterium GW2011_GWC1_41_20 TaxID=1618983 RepID=A0A0G0VH13_9BACT|nr:MAG: hypothetical protein ACD_66C00177G0004 [uncultured bacterium]KKR22466.1 MAG: hypothetical protein UT52_C0013G0015 [Candidatus Uhrbacteria bacterium GW2011_GWE1_39_46]KKR63817.1 MAG: hypothetical protein UU04_C0011G0007 [Candidatus Uhrbacteria bacterium GW2011_GWC2_40_450]KKR89952.1 MAG: hypothetical protein UU40_C0011G0015 [Candidatus Uhrbacteria bacterium GW2011_GWD2_41_121]KKR95826.1 MAG: hypothetical protein UU46_C0013G0015 [Candidatus Uhrbacteria bacterium GW2011_GWD1_41_16]KKR9893